MLKRAVTVLTVGLLVSVGLAVLTDRVNRNTAQEIFAERSLRLADGVHQRVLNVERGLRGARGVFLAAGPGGVTPDIFAQYSASRDVASEFPGAAGFGFIRRVPAGGEAEFVAKAHAQGRRDFAVRALAPHAGEAHVIEFFEPAAGAELTPGLDIAGNARHQAAAMLALRGNQAIMTAPLRALNAPAVPAAGAGADNAAAGAATHAGPVHQPQAATLVLLPVYRPGQALDTAEARERAGYGWTFVPLLTEALMHGLVLPDGELSIHLSDAGEIGDRRAPQASTSALEKTFSRAAFGRDWLITVSATPQFVDRLALRSPQAVLGGGLLATLLLTGLAGRSMRARRLHEREQAGFNARLESEVALRTEEIAQARRRIELATEFGGIGIWEFHVDPQRLVWEPGMYRLVGLTPDAAQHPLDLWRDHIHPEDRALFETVWQTAIANDEHFALEQRIVRRDGSIRLIRSAARRTVDARTGAVVLLGVSWDVTELRELATRLAEQHELMRVTLRSIGDAVITTGATGTVEWLNPAAERMTGWTPAEARGRSIAQVFHIVNEETRAPALDPVTLALGENRIVGLAHNTVLISRSGAEHGIEDSAAPIRDEQGRLFGAVLVFHDVTEQRRLSNEMNHRATHDGLTGLVNRAEFEARLARALRNAHDDRGEHAVMYVDLDQFKLVNDACGHAVGDQLLIQVSRLLNTVVRSRDTLARLGGDEFGVLLEHCTVEQGLRLAQNLCDRLDDFRFTHDERRFRIGASIGLVPVDNRWQNVESVLQAADAACFAAKEAGRNRVHTWFDTDLGIRARHGETRWAARMEDALERDRFVLHAQHIVPLHGDGDGDGAVQRAGVHAEALLRLVDEDGSLVPPSAFLPAAERFHLVTRIDRWVLQRAIDWLQGQAAAADIALLSVNLSGQSVGDRAFHRHASASLALAGAAVCQRLCLEITETAAVTNLADASVFIEDVRALGVRVALDDFGAGASSFGYLKSLRVDYLKIDGQYVQNLLRDPLDMATVQCFVQVAQVVGAQTVAEGVEDAEVLVALKTLGVDHVQGFLLHRPEPLNQLLTSTPATAG